MCVSSLYGSVLVSEHTNDTLGSTTHIIIITYIVRTCAVTNTTKYITKAKSETHEFRTDLMEKSLHISFISSLDQECQCHHNGSHCRHRQTVDAAAVVGVIRAAACGHLQAEHSAAAARRSGRHRVQAGRESGHRLLVAGRIAQHDLRFGVSLF